MTRHDDLVARILAGAQASQQDALDVLRTPDEDESLLVWPHGPFADVGPDSEIACRARSGDDW